MIDILFEMWEAVMDIDTDRIDDAVLAPCVVFFSRQCTRVEVFRLGRDRPAAREGPHHDPVGKAKSVVFTQEGLARSSGCFGNCL